LKSYINASHPSIWRFIDAIKKDEQMTFVESIQSDALVSVKYSRKRWLESQEKLQQVVLEYENSVAVPSSSNILAYLKRIAYHI
jgi:hypothetical protein